MRADIKQIRRIRNKVIKNWNLPDDKFETLFDDLYNQLSKSLFDDMSILGFLIRYLEINKSAFETGGFSSKTTDHKITNYDKTYELLKKCLLNKEIEVEAQFNYNLLKVNYEIKNWIIPQYQIDYINDQIAEVDNCLCNENYLGEDENPAFMINNIYKRGEKPNSNDFNHQDISITLSLIWFKQFLMDENEKLESHKNPIKTFKIGGDLSLEKNRDGQLTVSIPLDHITDQLKKEIKIPAEESTPVKQKPNKLLTSKQVSEMLQVSLQTLIEWRNDGIIDVHRIGAKQIRYRLEDVNKAIKKINIQPFSK